MIKVIFFISDPRIVFKLQSNQLHIDGFYKDRNL